MSTNSPKAPKRRDPRGESSGQPNQRVGPEDLDPASEVVRPEETPGFEDIGAEATGGGPDGEEETGRGPAFEVDR